MNEAPETPCPTGTDGLSTSTADFLQRIVDTIRALVVRALPDRSVDFINQGWRDYTGLSLVKLQGWAWSSVIHPDNMNRLKAEWD